MLGKNYMMNCISPDFKKAAFYKFDSTNKKLLMRTVKKKWKDFCDFDTENEQNINCTLNKHNIIRSSTIKDRLATSATIINPIVCGSLTNL